MHFSIYQIILGLIAVLFLVNSLSKFFKKENGQTLFKLFLSVFVWGSILLFSFFPESSRSLSEYLGLGSNLNTLIFIGFVILFIIFFKLINIIERIERNISEIVRKEALRKIQK